jgi:uncharacterized membrane protein
MSCYLALAVSILLTSLAQVLLKRGVSSKNSWFKSLFTWRSLVSYSIFGMVTVLSVYALQKIDLKTFGAWISVTYILVILLSWQILKEEIDRTTIIGCSLIIIGNFIFHLTL